MFTSIIRIVFVRFVVWTNRCWFRHRFSLNYCQCSMNCLAISSCLSLNSIDSSWRFLDCLIQHSPDWSILVQFGKHANFQISWNRVTFILWNRLKNSFFLGSGWASGCQRDRDLLGRVEERQTRRFRYQRTLWRPQIRRRVVQQQKVRLWRHHI